MLSFNEQAHAYANYHQDRITQYLHMLGIPLILLSVMILLGFVHIVILNVLDVDLSEIATLGLLIAYFRLQWRIALVITPLLAALLWIAQFFNSDGPTSFSLWSFGIIFLLGCLLQVVGYFIEGKRPPLTDALWQGLVAPLIIVAEIIFMLKLMPKLKEEIHGTGLQAKSTP